MDLSVSLPSIEPPSEPEFLPPPRTPDQMRQLFAVHGEFLGVCMLCGTAGHCDQIADIDGFSGECCQECLDKYRKELD